jgi:hypothetical protein
VVGALTTLELLRRITSARGLLNWYVYSDDFKLTFKGSVDLISFLNGRRCHLEYALHWQSSNHIIWRSKWITVIVRRRLHRVIPLYTDHRTPPCLRRDRRKREPAHLAVTHRRHVRRRSHLRNALLGISQFKLTIGTTVNCQLYQYIQYRPCCRVRYNSYCGHHHRTNIIL